MPAVGGKARHRSGLHVQHGQRQRQDAADLVEYLNAPQGSHPNGGTAWADVRAKNGHPEPYGIRYFEIGNEMYCGVSDSGSTRPVRTSAPSRHGLIGSRKLTTP